MAASGLTSFAEDSKPTPDTWPGKKSSFLGFDRYDFPLGELSCRVVVPKNAAAGRPWIWRARFFGHEPQLDVELLKRGFHVAFVSVKHLYGSPVALKRWDTFYQHLTTAHGFSRKPVLEGMSRGGLIIFNWAAANPNKVSCIYADAPVCDIKSWPGGKFKGIRSDRDWLRCLKVYGLTEEQAMSFKGNPIDQLDPLAKAKIPLIHVVGDTDTAVPVAENTAIIEKKYRALGGHIEVIHKKDSGHHPHSLKDPQPILDFILKHTGPNKIVN